MAPAAPRVVASIEARMSASRLPGKVLMDVEGAPALERLVRRLDRAHRLDAIVLATTTNPADDPLAEWAEARRLPCYRGSEDDVLDRVVEAQRMMGSEIVVEVCGDTPLLDPRVIDAAVTRYLEGGVDVVSNTARLTWPQGIDAQVFAFGALDKVARTQSDPAVREHVSLYFYEHPEIYRIHHLAAPEAETRPGLRLQLDYAEDLELIRAVYAGLEPTYGDGFGVREVLDLIARQPEIAALNADCEEKAAR
ncbi:MAG: spore coat biosynthesis protein F [Rhodospirillaceae bacterium]|nr:spore coat biosynthesis protein F [Rhodospirillaceae bacterium]